MLVVLVLAGAVDLQHAIRCLLDGRDEHIHGRDDAVLRVEVWQGQVGRSVQVADDDRLARDVGPPLRRAFIGLRDHPADNAGVPAPSGYDEQVIFCGAVAAHLAEWHLQGGGADARGLGQDLEQVCFLEGESAKGRQGGLLAQQLFDGAVTAAVRHLATPY